MAPTDTPGRPGRYAVLREICARALPFENRFLADYRRFVLAEPGGGKAGRLAALDALRRVRLADAEVQRAIGALAATGSTAVRTAAAVALRHQRASGGA